MKKNPFTAGRWVIGEQFFGRGELIEKLINSNESCDWVIGRRRMGKTSLLRQIEMEINQDEKKQALALFWDIQGSFDETGLSDSLVDAIEDSQDLYPEKWAKLDFEIPQDCSCPQVLKQLAKPLARENIRLHILIDEAEEFIVLREKSPTLLDKFRKFFQRHHNVHVVLCSSPKLETLHSSENAMTSPFLHGFHVSFLNNFDEVAGESLLREGISDGNVIDSILRITGLNPFETQLFAKHYFESEDFEKVTLELESNPSLKQVIEVNFDLLKSEEQTLVKDVFCGKTREEDYNAPGERAMIFNLMSMGYLNKDKRGLLGISSFFQQKWLETKFQESLQFHATHEQDRYLRRSDQAILKSQVLELYKFMLELTERGKKLSDFSACLKISKVDQSIYPDKANLNLVDKTGKGKSWQIAIRETAKFLNFFLEQNEEWSVYRFSEMCNSDLDQYTENDFLDILLLISEEAKLSLNP